MNWVAHTHSSAQNQEDFVQTRVLTLHWPDSCIYLELLRIEACVIQFSFYPEINLNIVLKGSGWVVKGQVYWPMSQVVNRWKQLLEFFSTSSPASPDFHPSEVGKWVMRRNPEGQTLANISLIAAKTPAWVSQ